MVASWSDSFPLVVVSIKTFEETKSIGGIQCEFLRNGQRKALTIMKSEAGIGVHICSAKVLSSSSHVSSKISPATHQECQNRRLCISHRTEHKHCSSLEWGLGNERLIHQGEGEEYNTSPTKAIPRSSSPSGLCLFKNTLASLPTPVTGFV